MPSSRRANNFDDTNFKSKLFKLKLYFRQKCRCNDELMRSQFSLQLFASIYQRLFLPRFCLPWHISFYSDSVNPYFIEVMYVCVQCCLSFLISEYLFIFFASLAYASYSPIRLLKSTLWISKEHNNFSYLWKFEPDILNSFWQNNLRKSRNFTKIVWAH